MFLSKCPPPHIRSPTKKCLRKQSWTLISANEQDLLVSIVERNKTKWYKCHLNNILNDVAAADDGGEHDD